jgi:hypothetical protein
MTMKILNILKGLCYVAGFFALASLGLLFLTIKVEIPKMLPALQQTIKEQGEETRKVTVAMVNKQGGDLQLLVAAELKNTRILVTDEIAKTSHLLSTELSKTRNTAVDITTVLDNRIAVIQADLDKQLTVTNSTLAESLKPFNSIGKQIDAVAPMFLDCEYNADCFFNRYVGTMRGIEKMSQNGAETSKSITKISDNVSKVTDEFVKPKPWYKTLLNYVTSSAIVVAKFF